MHNTRSRSRTPGKRIDTAQRRQPTQREEISALSPGNANLQFNTDKRPEPACPNRGSLNMSRRDSRSAQLPQPTTREVSSEEGSVIQDVDVPLEYWNDPRIAIPRSRQASVNAHGPWQYSTIKDRDTSLDRPARRVFDHGVVENPGLDRNGVKRASLSLAHKMLVKEHDRQVNKLGKKIYDSVMKVPTIDDAIFDSDSDDSDYTDSESSVARFDTRSQKDGSLGFVSAIAGLALVVLAAWFGVADFSKFNVVSCTAIAVLFGLGFGIVYKLRSRAERQEQANRRIVLPCGCIREGSLTIMPMKH